MALTGFVAWLIQMRNALAEMLFGSHGCCVHRVLQSTKDDFAEKRPSVRRFHNANLIHPAAGEIQAAVGGGRHVAHNAAARGNRGAREFFRLRIKLDYRVWL